MLEMTELDLVQLGHRYYVMANIIHMYDEHYCEVNGVRVVPVDFDALEWVNGYLESLEWEMLEEESMDQLIVNPRVWMADVLDPVELPDEHPYVETYLLFIPFDVSSATTFQMFECKGVEALAERIEKELALRVSLDIEAVILMRVVEIDLVLKVPSSTDENELERELTGE